MSTPSSSPMPSSSDSRLLLISSPSLLPLLALPLPGVDGGESRRKSARASAVGNVSDAGSKSRATSAPPSLAAPSSGQSVSVASTLKGEDFPLPSPSALTLVTMMNTASLHENEAEARSSQLISSPFDSCNVITKRRRGPACPTFLMTSSPINTITLPTLLSLSLARCPLPSVFKLEEDEDVKRAGLAGRKLFSSSSSASSALPIVDLRFDLSTGPPWTSNSSTTSPNPPSAGLANLDVATA
mmetsp:Transcript_12382/g.33171  ORF Transcript_12382/g.33171 Transcript_12382/m.33171 type:complete len:242 (-) Transcript_12382:604-1329(-)